MKQRKFKLSEAVIQTLSQREQETRDALELRRLQAVRLYGSGVDIKVIQQMSGVSRRTIQRWIDHYEARGLAGLKPGWKGGNHRGMSEAQRTAILVEIRTHRPKEVLDKDEWSGIEECWTVAAVQALVESRSGIVYRSVRSYHSLLEASGLSYQRPESTYRSRPNEAAIAEFEADTEKK